MRVRIAYRFGVCAVSSLWMAACAAPAPAPPASAHAVAAPISEEDIKPVGKVDIAIVDFTETPSADKRTVVLSGTLVNRGSRTTHAVYVHVEALDRDGAVLLSTDSEPSTEAIAPGATGRFTVRFEDRADVDRYHVEAISR